jgi:hypothetical protein
MGVDFEATLMHDDWRRDLMTVTTILLYFVFGYP